MLFVKSFLNMTSHFLIAILFTVMKIDIRKIITMVFHGRHHDAHLIHKHRNFENHKYSLYIHIRENFLKSQYLHVLP